SAGPLAGAAALRPSSSACGSKRSSRLVASPPRADGDHRHPVGPGDRHPGRPGIEAEERSHPDRDLHALDPVDARAADDDVDLLLLRLGLVVLETLGVRRELEPVDPERLDAELAAHEAHGAARAGALELVHTHDRIAHAYILKTPKVVSGIGAFSAAEIPSVSTRRVSSGSMIPSSQSRAVEWYGFPSCSYLARISSGSASPTIVRTVAACSPPMTEIRAFGHIQSWRGEYARPAIP